MVRDNYCSHIILHLEMKFQFEKYFFPSASGEMDQFPEISVRGLSPGMGVAVFSIASEKLLNLGFLLNVVVFGSRAKGGLVWRALNCN